MRAIRLVTGLTRALLLTSCLALIPLSSQAAPSVLGGAGCSSGKSGGNATATSSAKPSATSQRRAVRAERLEKLRQERAERRSALRDRKDD